MYTELQANPIDADTCPMVICRKVLAILGKYRMTPEEIHNFFSTANSGYAEDWARQAAEEIVGLFIAERLSIAEGATVIQQCKDWLS